MGAVKRAFLYLRRKRSKSVLLFVILLVLMTLVMTAAAIGNGAGKAAAELRSTLGGYFKVEDNLQYSGKREAITDDLITRIGGLEGVKISNKMNLEYLMTPELSLEAGRFTAEEDERAHLARFLGNTYSSLHEYFLLRSFQLVEGRHIGPQDMGKVLISRELASLNGLSIGDTIWAEIFSEEIGNGGKHSADPYVWEVVGIFDSSAAQDKGGMAAECDMVNNFIFADLSSMMKVQTDKNPENAGKYRGASFFADDPGQLNAIVGKARGIEDVNWDSLEMNINDKAYKNAVVPLEKLETYTRLFLMAIIVVSIVLLSLILTMWMRDRLQEIGIFLSIGISKVSLFGQHITEVLAMLLLALVVAFPVSLAAAGYAGNTFLEHMPREEMQQEKENRELFYQPVDLAVIKNEESVAVNVGTNEFLTAGLYGISISLAAVGLSSILIMRLKPKDILSAVS